MRLTFLVTAAFGMGGVPRTVFALAGELVERGHDVEIVAMERTAPQTRFPLDRRVRLTWLFDLVDADGNRIPRPRKRPRARPDLRELDRQPSSLATQTNDTFSALLDRRLEQRLRAIEDGVVITTRPELAVAAARWTRPSVVTVHQEHLARNARKPALRDALVDVTRPDAEHRLDAMLTLTQDELDGWADLLEPTDTRMGVIPNATPFPLGPAAPLDNPRIVAVGRLTQQKGFGRLIRAFAPIARAHPDWSLEIYGHGPQQQALQELVERLGVGAQVRLPGTTDRIEEVLTGSSVFAMSSRYEGLPMVLLEAMSKGVPPVSFDCPEGPRQLIDTEHNGLLVPEGDVPALTEALVRVVADPGLRRRLGAGALERAREYGVAAITDRWEALFEELVAARPAR